MGWCPNPLNDFLNFVNAIYLLLIVYVFIGFLFAFILALKCYVNEPKLFKYPMIFICTSLGHIFLYYYYYSLRNDGLKSNFNLCSSN